MNNISINMDTLSAETLQFLILLIDCPYSAPETLLNNLWEKKIKLQTQKSLQFTVNTFNYETRTFTPSILVFELFFILSFCLRFLYYICVLQIPKKN